MPFQDSEYKMNQAILKDYGGMKYKLTNLKYLRTSGLDYQEKKFSPKGTVNTEKLTENISRAKATVMELALCNEWAYWATFTLDPKKYDRTNLEKYRHDLTQWLRNQGKKHGCTIKYLLVPELHKDGKNWHMHGFIMGLPDSERRLFQLDEKLPHYIRHKLEWNEKVYDWPAYRDKFGFVDMEPVRHRESCAKYVTKYISKELEKTITELGAHLYYCSQGLIKATEIKKGTMIKNMEPDFENDYVRIKWYANTTPVATLTSMIHSQSDNVKTSKNTNNKKELRNNVRI